MARAGHGFRGPVSDKPWFASPDITLCQFFGSAKSETASNVTTFVLPPLKHPLTAPDVRTSQLSSQSAAPGIVDVSSAQINATQEQAQAVPPVPVATEPPQLFPFDSQDLMPVLPFQGVPPQPPNMSWNGGPPQIFWSDPGSSSVQHAVQNPWQDALGHHALQHFPQMPLDPKPSTWVTDQPVPDPEPAPQSVFSVGHRVAIPGQFIHPVAHRLPSNRGSRARHASRNGPPAQQVSPMQQGSWANGRDASCNMEFQGLESTQRGLGRWPNGSSHVESDEPRMEDALPTPTAPPMPEGCTDKYYVSSSDRPSYSRTQRDRQLELDLDTTYRIPPSHLAARQPKLSTDQEIRDRQKIKVRRSVRARLAGQPSSSI